MTNHTCRLRSVLLSAAVAGFALVSQAQTVTVNALRNYVANECGGDWNRITRVPAVHNFSGTPLNGFAGTFSANPAVSTVPDAHEIYYGGWFRNNFRVGGTTYPVDVFTRLQTADRAKPHQNFLRVYSNGDDYLAWHQYFNITAQNQFSHPIWTGQTYDVLTPQSQDLHARWRCGMRYPSNNSIRFSAMHELYINSSSGVPVRIQVEVRQSSNQGTVWAPGRPIYTCPTYGSQFYVNGFSHPAYKVWTFTLVKNYDPSSIYDGYINLSRIVHFLRANPNVWGGGTFPSDGSIRRVETGVETWFGGDGSQFTSYLTRFWRQ
jgi:hypothetical protein